MLGNWHKHAGILALASFLTIDLAILIHFCHYIPYCIICFAVSVLFLLYLSCWVQSLIPSMSSCIYLQRNVRATGSPLLEILESAMSHATVTILATIFNKVQQNNKHIQSFLKHLEWLQANFGQFKGLTHIYYNILELYRSGSDTSVRWDDKRFTCV